MKKCFLGILALFFGLGVFAQTAAIAEASDLEISVTGNVQFPGKQILRKGSRLFDAVLPAQVGQDAYILGAAWFTESELIPQSKLKLEVLFDLDQLILDARANNQYERAALGLGIKKQIEETAVTGRRRVTLDPIHLELDRLHNRPLSQGDHIIYPSRPATILVVGALQKNCSLPFIGLRLAHDYLRDCPVHSEADQDWLWIIQPDGAIHRTGIGAWNADAPQTLAPGATLFVPLRNSRIYKTETLNAELVQFISTQPMLGIAVLP